MSSSSILPPSSSTRDFVLNRLVDELKRFIADFCAATNLRLSFELIARNNSVLINFLGEEKGDGGGEEGGWVRGGGDPGGPSHFGLPTDSVPFPADRPGSAAEVHDQLQQQGQQPQQRHRHRPVYGRYRPPQLNSAPPSPPPPPPPPSARTTTVFGQTLQIDPASLTDSWRATTTTPSLADPRRRGAAQLPPPPPPPPPASNDDDRRHRPPTNAASKPGAPLRRKADGAEGDPAPSVESLPMQGLDIRDPPPAKRRSGGGAGVEDDDGLFAGVLVPRRNQIDANGIDAVEEKKLTIVDHDDNNDDDDDRENDGDGATPSPPDAKRRVRFEKKGGGFVCSKCGQFFNRFRNYYLHQVKRHEKRKKEEVLEGIPEKRFKCPDCLFSSDCKREIDRHRRKYHHDLYKCDQCSFATYTRTKLKDHAQIYH